MTTHHHDDHADPAPEDWTYQPRTDRDWTSDAACLTADPELFYPERGDQFSSRRARQLCAECPVQHDCLDYALTMREDHGIWGGLTERERRQLRRTHDVTAPHGTHARYQQHIRDGDDTCDPCKQARARYMRSYRGTRGPEHLAAMLTDTA